MDEQNEGTVAGWVVIAACLAILIFINWVAK